MNSRKYKLYSFFLVIFLLSNYSWAQTPPTITATGDQVYCPLSSINIATSFDIVPGDEQIDAVFIQISENYINNEDFLSLTGSHPTIATSWSASEGKLTLTAITPSPTAYIYLIAAVTAVVFQSNSSAISGEKHFSITIDEANYLPSTDHYYEYVPDIGITWSDAKIAAENRTHYGLQGYLATITSSEEAQLSGEQAQGAGWIGGSDEENEDTWKWVTGPEAGQTFWIGDENGTTIGTDIPYEFWNNGEPNQAGNEDYAHITAPNVGIPGSWNDLSNTGSTSGDYQPKGYIVEYGGMPGDPILNISGSTKISVAAIDTITEGSTCGTGTVLLSATATLGADVLWFDSPTGGTQLFTGLNYTAPTITSTTTYYALASVGGCIDGDRTPVIATVFEIPTIASTQDTTICGAGSGIVTASASAGIINWYSTVTGGTSLGTGTTFTSPSITITTTYFVDATENGCTTATRVPVTINVQYTLAPTTTALQQQFCDIENATLDELLITGNSILWYNTPIGGTQLASSDLLVNNTTYYASQTVNGCESPARLAVAVLVFETVTPPAGIDPLAECDTNDDGDDMNGLAQFDLTLNEFDILNGKLAADFSFTYFTDASYSAASQILNETVFLNTNSGGQTIYARIANNLDSTCNTDTSFEIIVNELPTIQSSISFENCDEDGIADGFTDFNLDEANTIITNGVR